MLFLSPVIVETERGILIKYQCLLRHCFCCYWCLFFYFIGEKFISCDFKHQYKKLFEVFLVQDSGTLLGFWKPRFKRYWRREEKRRPQNPSTISLFLLCIAFASVQIRLSRIWWGGSKIISYLPVKNKVGKWASGLIISYFSLPRFLFVYIWVVFNSQLSLLTLSLLVSLDHKGNCYWN